MDIDRRIFIFHHIISYHIILYYIMDRTPYDSMASLASGVSDEFARQVLEKAPCLLYVYDLSELRNVWASKRLMEALGYTRAEIDAMPGGIMKTQMHPEDRERYRQHLTRLVQLSDAGGAEFDYRLRRADGVWIWLHSCETVFLREGDGTVRQVLGAALDVTLQRTAAANLAESEARFREMADGLPLIVWVHDAEGRQEFVNETFCRFFGVSREEMRGSAWQILMHPQDARSYLSQFQEAVAKRSSFNAEVRVRNAAGEWRWIESWARPRLSADGVFLGVVGTSADVTVRKEIEQQIRSSEERYRMTFENAPVGIAEVSLDGRFTTFNTAVTEITGYFETELRGKPWSDIAHSDDVGPDRDLVSQLLSGEISIFTNDKRFRRKDGSITWICLTASLIRNAEGEPLHFLMIIEDISARKVAEASLIATRAKLEEHAANLERTVAERTRSLQDSITELEHFSYTVAHDLRAPLRAITQFSTFLVEDYGWGLDDTAKGYIERINRAGARMHALTTDLLRYTSVGSRAATPMQNVALETVLDEVIEAKPELPREAQIVIAAPLLPVLGHTTLLRQIFANLLENAVKYTQPGVRPKIVIRTEPRVAFSGDAVGPNYRRTLYPQSSPPTESGRLPEGPQPAPDELSGNAVRLWVEDNGIGIAPEFHDRIFRIFERLQVLNSEGTGIGLAIVARAAERMGGRCGVESMLGKGSRFWIELKPGQEARVGPGQ
jgi:PAS domain S-box-containing protein